jgi:hypothetical protein
VVETRLRKLVGICLFGLGLYAVAWGLLHYADPLVRAGSHLGEPVYFGVSRQIGSFMFGLMLLYYGCCIYLGRSL